MEKTIIREKKELEIYDLIIDYISDLERCIKKHQDKLNEYRLSNDKEWEIYENQIIKEYKREINKNQERINMRRRHYWYMYILSFMN